MRSVFSAVGLIGMIAAALALSGAQQELLAQTSGSANLAEATSKLKAYFASIESMEAVYTQTPIGGGDYRDVSNWRWMKSGSRKLLSLNAEPGGAGIKVPHGWWSFDGENAYSVGVDNAAPKRITHIYRTETIDQMYFDMPNPLQILGHPLQNSQETLVGLLPNSKVVGLERIGQFECVRVELPSIQVAGGERAVTFWLDPTEGFLPRRYFQREPTLKEVREASSKDAFFVWDIDEFTSVNDELLGGDQRFPKIARLSGTGGVHRYELSVVKLNRNLARSQFIPQAQIGTEMIVRRAGQEDLVTVFGGQAGVAKKQAENVARAKELTAKRKATMAGGPPVDARPPSPSLLWIVSSVLFAVVLFGVMLKMRIRH